MPDFLTRFAAPPFNFHWAPNAQGCNSNKCIPKICSYPNNRHTIDIKRIAIGSGNSTGWFLNEPPEIGICIDCSHFRSCLRMSLYPVSVATAASNKKGCACGEKKIFMPEPLDKMHTKYLKVNNSHNSFVGVVQQLAGLRI